MINIQELSNNDKRCLVALYYARLNSNDERYKGITAKLEKAGEILHCPSRTIGNIKDAYDFYFDNGREGWKTGKLTPMLQPIFEKYRDNPIDELEKAVYEILNLRTVSHMEGNHSSTDDRENSSQMPTFISKSRELLSLYQTNTKLETRYAKSNFLKEVYITSNQYDTLAALLKHKKNVILQGAPGVGKTFTAKRLAYAIMGEKDDSRIEFVQFHQSYSYEDFIMGYRPTDDGSFELKEGVFYRFCDKVRNDPDRQYFFIIDEINRGNLSKIFGELLMLIEKDYRSETVTLAYRDEKFSVPENLYIIGMMNTADRSLAMIDYALRRRFSFFEMSPGFDSDGFNAYSLALNNELFNALIAQIKLLNNEIENDNALGKGFCIGHSYFCNLTDWTCTDERLREIVEYDVIPMLSEYWFDDKDKADKWSENLRGLFNDD